MSAICSPTDLGVSDLVDGVDLVALIDVLHEMEQPADALRQMVATLRPGVLLLLIEPKGHVRSEHFEAELVLARQMGLEPVDPSTAGLPRGPWSALFRRS